MSSNRHSKGTATKDKRGQRKGGQFAPTPIATTPSVDIPTDLALDAKTEQESGNSHKDSQQGAELPTRKIFPGQIEYMVKNKSLASLKKLDKPDKKPIRVFEALSIIDNLISYYEFWDNLAEKLGGSLTDGKDGRDSQTVSDTYLADLISAQESLEKYKKLPECGEQQLLTSEWHDFLDNCTMELKKSCEWVKTSIDEEVYAIVRWRAAQIPKPPNH